MPTENYRDSARLDRAIQLKASDEIKNTKIREVAVFKRLLSQFFSTIFFKKFSVEAQGEKFLAAFSEKKQDKFWQRILELIVYSENVEDEASGFIDLMEHLKNDYQERIERLCACFFSPCNLAVIKITHRYPEECDMQEVSLNKRIKVLSFCLNDAHEHYPEAAPALFKRLLSAQFDKWHSVASYKGYERA